MAKKEESADPVRRVLPAVQPGCRSVLLPVLCSPDAAQPCCFGAFCCFIVLLGGGTDPRKIDQNEDGGDGGDGGDGTDGTDGGDF